MSERALQRAEVEDIRRRYADGERQVALAEEYGISWSAISQCVRGITYTDGPGPITPASRLLDPRDIEEIRHAAAQGVAKLALAREYDVSRSLVRRIVAGAIYADCAGPIEAS